MFILTYEQNNTKNSRSKMVHIMHEILGTLFSSTQYYNMLLISKILHINDKNQLRLTNSM